jgi:hypothetical protein
MLYVSFLQLGAKQREERAMGGGGGWSLSHFMGRANSLISGDERQVSILTLPSTHREHSPGAILFLLYSYICNECRVPTSDE